MKMEMRFGVQAKYTDGIGGWTDWKDIARFRYRSGAQEYIKYVESYQHEEAAIDRVQLREAPENTE